MPLVNEPRTVARQLAAAELVGVGHARILTG